jgi:hypothetical protein
MADDLHIKYAVSAHQLAKSAARQGALRWLLALACSVPEQAD